MSNPNPLAPPVPDSPALPWQAALTPQERTAYNRFTAVMYDEDADEGAFADRIEVDLPIILATLRRLGHHEVPTPGALPTWRRLDHTAPDDSGWPPAGQFLLRASDDTVVAAWREPEGFIRAGVPSGVFSAEDSVLLDGHDWTEWLPLSELLALPSASAQEGGECK